ncbi:P-loop NTPase fold protein [Streptomyces sp. 147326]|uniref:P-loop NTPase fold protein n=1 Tax=Streptomyces sp. 147326 TaxID=3074379 RepID=UPI0038578F38
MVAILCVGALLWHLRNSYWFLRAVLKLFAVFVIVTGALLRVVPVASVVLDSQIRRNGEAFFNSGRLLYFLCLVLILSAVVLEHMAGRSLTVADVRVVSRRFLPLAEAVLIGGILWLLLATPSSRAIIGDEDNPLRLVCMFLGLLIGKVVDWSPKEIEPKLVTECRDYLYRIQTVQSSSSTTTTGLTQVVSVGTANATSVSTMPPSFPELVADFRTCLEKIALEMHTSGQRVVIAIDEVDRLGSDRQALAFLGEVKAILGVPRVFFLVSVAEDVGAAFVRRGLPHRDVTDSSLDDVIHVRPCTLSDSSQILRMRAPGISSPYIILAHALSGGLPRDLIRYGRQIMEIGESVEAFELSEISRSVVVEELSETIAGFRTLLAKQSWTFENSSLLDAFRLISSHLLCSCAGGARELRRALRVFSMALLDDVADADIEDSARQLAEEASVFAYFALTLLEIFGEDGFARRKEAAAHSINGDPEMLAEARRELAISPHSARRLITGIRGAWGLSVEPIRPGRRRISAARPIGCDERCTARSQ